MALLVKVMVRLVCLCVCVWEDRKCTSVSFFLSAVTGYTFYILPSLHLCPLLPLFIPPKVVVTSVDLCMDCVCMDFLLLTVTLTTVSIVSVTYTANMFRHCRVALREGCLLLPLLASQKLMHHPNSRCAAASAASDVGLLCCVSNVAWNITIPSVLWCHVTYDRYFFLCNTRGKLVFLCRFF